MTPRTVTPAHEETAGAVGAAAGGQTPQEGIEMNTTIIARDADMQTEWLAAHASKVVSAQPAWAQSEHTEVDFDTEDGHAEAILFSRRVGSVAIEQLFTVDGDSISAADEPHVWEEVDGHSLAADRASIVGVDMLRAAQILNGGGNIGAGLFDVIGKELGVSGADLHALADVDKDPENDITVGDLFRMSRFVGLTPFALYELAKTSTATATEADR